MLAAWTVLALARAWHDCGVYPVLLLAAIAILGGVLLVAMGGGGEMALFSRDVPIALRNPRTPGEVANQRLPLGPIGYQVQATEEALVAAANLLAERDREIAALRSELWRLTAPAPQVGEQRADTFGCPASGGDAGVDEGASSDVGDEAPAAGLAGTDQAWRQ